MGTPISLVFLLVAFVKYADGSLSVTVSKELTNDGFQYSCILSPGSINSLVTFKNPAGSTVGGCAVPTNPTTSGICSSGTSPPSTVTQDMSTSTTTIDIPAGYITGNTGLTGSWSCSHGTDEATVSYSNILAFNQNGVRFTSHTSGELLAKDVKAITFRMDCLYPSATYDIEYLDDDGNKVIYTQTLFSSACTNVAASCTTTNSNAFGQDCTFSVDESKLASKTKIQVKARVTGMHTTNYPTIVSNFIIKKSGGLSPCAIAGIVIAVVEIIAAVVLVILWKKKLLCFKEPKLRCGDKAGIVIAVLVGVVVIPAVVIVILWKMKKLCFKVPTEEKPTGSTNSGDKKIDRLSVVNEKAQKPKTPGHLTADTVASPKPRALPPIPEKEAKKEKKKRPKKKRKKTKNEDGGEDSVKVPSIEKKEKNMEHYTENKKEYESQ